MSEIYKQSGVDKDEAKALYKILQSKLRNKTIGSFTGAANFKDKYVVSCTEGIGSKVIPLYAKKRYKTIANDVVAANLNNLCTQKSTLISFSDYIATNKLNSAAISEIIINIEHELIKYDCELTGGETSELPDVIKENNIAISGTAIGIADSLPLNEKYSGSLIIGLKSNGIHSSGFSVIRKLYKEKQLTDSDFEEALKPSYNYYNAVNKLWTANLIKSAANITGGGINENILRIIPEKRAFNTDFSTIPSQKIYEKLKSVLGSEMYQIFNCGVGFCVVADRADKEIIFDICQEFEPFEFGEVI
ncbi:MAG: AIR synthase-related protein [Clostridiaceae bacterium]|jgi:phosphoribosylformylglycinamidine cyclo-ligase|nr:AIR synthase-related protein [Clostridiaceae bacterium]